MIMMIMLLTMINTYAIHASARIDLYWRREVKLPLMSLNYVGTWSSLERADSSCCASSRWTTRLLARTRDALR